MCQGRVEDFNGLILLNEENKFFFYITVIKWNKVHHCKKLYSLQTMTFLRFLKRKISFQWSMWKVCLPCHCSSNGVNVILNHEKRDIGRSPYLLGGFFGGDVHFFGFCWDFWLVKNWRYRKRTEDKEFRHQKHENLCMLLATLSYFLPPSSSLH